MKKRAFLTIVAIILTFSMIFAITSCTTPETPEETTSTETREETTQATTNSPTETTNTTPIESTDLVETTETETDEDVTDEAVTTEAVTTEDETTEAVTTENVTTEAVTTEAVTTENVTTEAVTTEAVTTENVTTEDETTEAVTTEDVTTEAVTTEAVTTEDVTTEAVTTEDVTTEAVTTEAVTTEAITTEAVTDEAVTTEAVTTEAVTTEEETTEDETTEPIETTTPEITTEIEEEAKVEKFLYFTDPHYITSGAEASWKPNADSHFFTMKSIYTSSGAKFAMCGGDWLNDSNTRASALQIMASIKSKMIEYFGKAYLMIGNHDYNYQKIEGGSTIQSEHMLTPEEIASVWFSEYGKTYYSFKGDATTFYVFDSGIDWSHGRVNELDREQIKWYIASLNATDDKHIAIAPHMLYVNDVTWMIHPATEIIAEISNAYNNRLTYTFDGVTYDFGSKTGRVEFIIAGHTHLDEIGTFHGIPYIVTNASHSTGSNGEPTFDIVTVDYENRVITTDRTGTGSDRTIYLDPCTQNHYETNASGHRVSESCEKCGLRQSSAYRSHTAPTVKTVTDGATTRYDYVCETCGYVFYTVNGASSDVNYFSAPGQVYVRWEGGKPFEIKKEGDQIFTRAHLTHAYGSFCVSNREGLVEKAYTAEWDEIKNGSGKYAVFKLRASGVTNLTFGLQSDATLTDFPDSAFVSRYHSGGFDNWKIYVVDLSKMAAPAYSVDNKSVTNVVFGFRAASASANAYIDLAYFAICDNWEEIASVVGDQNVYYTNWRDPSNDVQRPSNGACEGDHSIKLTVSGNNYTYACEFCNFKTEQTVSVGANSVNFFSAPGQQYNNYNVPNGSNASRHSTGTLKYDTVGGFVYNSLAFGGSGSMVFGDGSAVLNGMEDYTKNTVYGTGKYFVIKFRAQSQITEMKIGAYDGTNSKVIADKNAATAGSGTDAIYETNMRGGTVPTDWKVFVISIEDMLDKSVPFYTAGGTEQTTASFGFKIKNGSAYAGTVDIAYFAVCDNWTEIDSIVGNDSVVLTSWENTVADVTLSSADIDNKVIEEAK